MVYYTFCISVKPIVRNRVTKLGFAQPKNGLSERDLPLKGLKLNKKTSKANAKLLEIKLINLIREPIRVWNREID